MTMEAEVVREPSTVLISAENLARASSQEA